MIYVFRRANSQSAFDLAEALDGRRMKTPERLIQRARPNDKVVMWGDYIQGVNGKTLNNVPMQSKYEDALRLKEAGIRTVEVARTKPVPVVQPTPVDPLIAAWEQSQDIAEAFVGLEPSRNAVARQGLIDFVGSLNRLVQEIDRPAPVAPPPVTVGEWIARRNNHVGGNDLLAGITVGDYYSRKEAFVNEYRVHSFMGRSIRAGRKVLREGFIAADDVTTTPTPRAHPWVRSYEGGWMITYEGDQVRQKHRDIAHAAVKALGLSFGAVDIGELADGTLVVLEVNRAPGVEGGTIEAYQRAISRWISGEWATYPTEE